LSAAIHLIRKRLSIRQADLAVQLGCKQNTVSKYEAGAAHPGMEILAKLWEIADLKERALIRDYIYEQFFFLSELEHEAFTQAVTQGQPRPFPLAMAEVLGRPEAPAFLRQIMGLYLRYRRHADAPQIFERAITWLQIQFQLLGYLDLKNAAPSKAPDTVERELREAASESLPQGPEPKPTSTSNFSGRKKRV